MTVVWRIDSKGRFYRYMFRKGSIIRFYAKDNIIPDSYAGVVIADSLEASQSI